MRAYILPSHVRIEPFGDPVGDSMIGNRTLAAYQTEVLGDAGLDVVRIEDPSGIRDGEFLVTWDDVFFTRRVLASLIEQFRERGASVRCGLPADSLLVRHTAPLQELDRAEVEGEHLALYRLYLVQASSPPGDREGLDRLLTEAGPVRARFKEKVLEVPVPPNIVGQASFSHPLTSSVVVQVGHWVHVLWANQLAIQIRWVETIMDHKLWLGRKLLTTAVAGLVGGKVRLPDLKWSLAGRMNRIGRNCDIHPTARVEFSQLGDNVRIGANALVRGCLIGDGVQIEDRACIIFCVIGERCFISKNSVLVFCAGYPDGDLCINGIQCTLFGRKVAMTSLVRVIDIKAQGEIKVMHRGKLLSVGTNFLGACFGHGAFGGLDVTIQSGRTIPNGAVLVKDPDQILRKIPDDLPPGEPAWAEGGRAVTGKDGDKS